MKEALVLFLLFSPITYADVNLPRYYIQAGGGFWYSPEGWDFNLNHKISPNTFLELGAMVFDAQAVKVSAFLGGQFSPQTLRERAGGGSTELMSFYIGAKGHATFAKYGFPFISVALGIDYETGSKTSNHTPPKGEFISIFTIGYEYVFFKHLKTGVQLDVCLGASAEESNYKWISPMAFIGFGF